MFAAGLHYVQRVFRIVATTEGVPDAVGGHDGTRCTQLYDSDLGNRTGL